VGVREKERQKEIDRVSDRGWAYLCERMEGRSGRIQIIKKRFSVRCKYRNKQTAIKTARLNNEKTNNTLVLCLLYIFSSSSFLPCIFQQLV
jgi:hypothetical protein